jgi:hypothetical protein
MVRNSTTTQISNRNFNEHKMIKRKEKQTSFEPGHNKTNIVHLRPAWIQTSLRIRAV